MTFDSCRRFTLVENTYILRWPQLYHPSAHCQVALGVTALTVSLSVETFLAWKSCVVLLPDFPTVFCLGLRLDFFDSPGSGRRASFFLFPAIVCEGSYRSGRVLWRGRRAYRCGELLMLDGQL